VVSIDASKRWPAVVTDLFSDRSSLFHVIAPYVMSSSPTTSSRLGLRIEQARWEFALPDGARRLIASGDFEGRTNDTLVRWLASDRELAKRLLRWCNTPLFNLSKPYRSLEEASKVMDGRDLTRLAVLAFVRGLFLPDLQIDIYRRDALWSHSVAVGAVAAMISRTCGCSDPSLVFVAGALHDIGLYASERLDPETFAEVMSQIDALSPTHEVEKDLLGWDHTQLGQAILNQWGLPEEVQMVARYHHQPEQAIAGPHGESIGCVAIANYLCSRSGWSSAGSHCLPPPSNRVFSHLGIDSGLFTVLWQQLYPALDSVAQLR
jgi:putative nucleotidyltransferase with HDIG domain